MAQAIRLPEDRMVQELLMELAIALYARGLLSFGKGRVVFRKNFVFNGRWRGRFYAVKQVAPVVAEESDKFVVVTVYVYYF